MNPINHVAIIMDGNGRWGLKYKNSRNAGHKEGLKTVEKIIKETINHKIKYLTLYAFSTENWKRPRAEIDYLFKLLESFLINRMEDLNKQNIRLKIIGVKNLMNSLPLTASSLYAKNLFSFIRNLYSKEKKDFNINLEDEIIKKSLIEKV